MSAKATWVKLPGDLSWHAVSAIVGGKLWIAHCGKQWSDSAMPQSGEHDRRVRCDDCQRRVIEAMRVGVCLEELQRSVLWEAEMDS